MRLAPEGGIHAGPPPPSLGVSPFQCNVRTCFTLIDKLCNEDLWKGIIPYGENVATCKKALTKCLYHFAGNNQSTVSWDEFSASFPQEYL
jgi:hypothetical protein